MTTIRFQGSLSLLAGLCLIGLGLNLTSCSTTGRHAAMQVEKAVPLGAALGQAERSSKSGLRSESERIAYAADVAGVVRAWQAQDGPPVRGKPVLVQEGGASYTLTATWPDSVRFDHLLPIIPQEQRQMETQVLRGGVGTPFVANWKYSKEREVEEPFLSEGGYLIPVTVTVDFRPMRKGAREARLTVHDARAQETATIAGRRQPLAADFTAVGEYILVKSKEKGFGMSGMKALRNSEKYLDKLGIIALEPPSHDRVPVIFVHGLMSRPLTWQNALNSLTDDPTIRRNYQIFFFRYPTGVPVAYSAAKFRKELAILHQEMKEVGNHAPSHHMVLVGHSMGGLVSKLQLTSSGDALWVNVMGDKPENLKLTEEERKSFDEYLSFEPNPYVDRVIFVCTPHRGSKMAEGIMGSIGRSLVHLPFQILGNTFSLLQGEAPRSGAVRDLLKKGVPSSIENLSPKSRFVQNSNQLKFKPGLHMHSIIGNKKGLDLTDPKCSDGVVPYTSAHMPGVESELVVPGDHGAQARPEAIAEMRRILLLHLKTLHSKGIHTTH